MTLEIWLAYAVACIVVLAIPGPTVLLVVSYALGGGRRTGWATVPGVTLGDFTALTLSLLGAGAVLAASAAMFTVLKLVGAAYLVWLGIRLWRAAGRLGPTAAATASPHRMFRDAYVVTALNPKGIVFFVAFVPQFVDPSAAALPQFIMLEATFVTLAAVNVAIWAVLAGELRDRLRNPAKVRLVNRVGGSVLVGAGILTALARRAS